MRPSPNPTQPPPPLYPQDVGFGLVGALLRSAMLVTACSGCHPKQTQAGAAARKRTTADLDRRDIATTVRVEAVEQGVHELQVVEAQAVQRVPAPHRHTWRTGLHVGGVVRGLSRVLLKGRLGGGVWNPKFQKFVYQKSPSNISFCKFHFFPTL